MASPTRIAQGDIAGVTASADLSAKAKLYKAVKIGATGKTATLCGANEKADGILVNSPASGEAMDIMSQPGSMKARVDGNAGAIAIGDWLESDADGDLVKTTTDKHNVLAKSLGVSTAAGDVITVDWGPFTLSI